MQEIQVQSLGSENPLQYSYMENPMDREAWRGYIPWGHRVGHDLAIEQQQQMSRATVVLWAEEAEAQKG